MTHKYFTCPECREDPRFKSMATDRVELEREKGERLRVACTHCYGQLTVHVNDIKAAPNKIITGLGVAAGVAATAALWHFGAVAWASGALPVIIYIAQQKAAEAFNGYQIRRS